MTERHWPNSPVLDDLLCLNGWPEGTIGYNQETRIIALLLTLCQGHGFGRIPSLAAQVEDIWRHPERIEYYQQVRDRRQELLAQDKEWLKNWEIMKKHLLAYITVLDVAEVTAQLAEEHVMIGHKNLTGCLIFLCEALDKRTDDEAAIALNNLIRDRERINGQPEGNEAELAEVTERCARACLEYLSV